MQPIKFIFLLFVLFMFGCKTKQIVIAEAAPSRTMQPGKCYIAVTYPDENKKLNKLDKPFVIKLVPTEFEQKEIFVRTKEFIYPDTKDTSFSLPIVAHYTKLVFNNEQFKNCVSSSEAKGFLICFVEVPAVFKQFTKSELEESNYYISQKVVKRPSRITKRYVKNEPRKLWANQYFFEAGFSSELREALANGHHNNYLALKIQEKLIKKGYELKKNNQIDEPTKAALIDYQRKNGLKEGYIDFETLKHLGVDY